MTSERVKSEGASPGSAPVDGARPSRRELQAEQTRRDILSSARRLFAVQGYSATTLKDIAADASVSVQTVYDSVGGKPQLVRRLNDLIDEEAGVGELAAGLPHESDPAVLTSIPAQITRRLLERCGDILRAVLAGSYVEPDLVALLEEGQSRHRAGAEAVVRRLDVLGALRPDLSRAAATRTIAALADFRLALVLLDDLSLDFNRLESWIADTTGRAVLRP